MVTSGVVWCYKDNHWIPLQLSSIRLHGVLTQAHWVAVSDFLQRMANKQLVLQDNCFKELTEQQKELLLEEQKKLEFSRAVDNNQGEDIDQNLSQLVLNTLNNNVLNNDSVIKLNENNKNERCITTPNGRVIQISKSEIGEDKDCQAADSRLNAENQVLMFKFEKDFTVNELNAETNKNLFINNLFTETDSNSIETNHDRSPKIEDGHRTVNNCSSRKTSTQSDEIALRLLRKYCKYSRDALDDDILSAIEATELNSNEDKTVISPPAIVRTRKLGYCPKNEKLYENCSDVKFSLDEAVENDRNEHVLRWLKQQNRQGYTNKRRCSLPTFSSNRKSSVSSLGEPSPTDSRKSSLTIKSDGNRVSLRDSRARNLV
ncbi:hypothetical protein MML48_2g00018605 [Holotrichia oblita]|uniref:Uncharacterized protein n=1 Tax=Holotrichia oblita TaxID=644536 RepID=A0ACB9TQR0_HOLOL|nr:hypothetical protein MML48_2g00018605 [Holotrichia oblita]